MLRRRCKFSILTERLVNSDFSATNQAYCTKPKDSAISGFVRGKSVIGREGLAAQLKVNSSQRKDITDCNL